MNRLLFAFCATALLFSCKSKPKGPQYEGKLTNHYIAGTWMVTGSDFSEAQAYDRETRDSLDLQVTMQIYKFDNKGNVDFDNALPVPEKGQYETGDKLLKVKFDNRLNFFRVQQAADSSIILVIDKSTNANMKGGRISLKRVNTEKYDIGNFSWKEQPRTPLTDEQIKEKLHQMVVYYENMFNAMVSRNIDVLVPRKVMMPLGFYSNGLSLKTMEAARGWTGFFGGEKPAERAYELLSAAYDRIDYFPSYQNNYFDLYARCLRKLDAALLNKAAEK